MGLRMVDTAPEQHFTKVANDLLEALIAAPLGGGQLRLMLHIVRQTDGYHRPADQISAAQFAKATGLHPKVVARELRDLAARGYLLPLAEQGRTTAYRVQKDPAQWETGNQNVPGSGNQEVPRSEPKGSTPPEPKGSRSYREERKPKEKAEPDGSGADAPSRRSRTMRQRFQEEYQGAANQGERIGVVGRFFKEMLGPPDYARLGKLLKEAKSGGAMFMAMAEAAKQPLTDDPHDYVAKILGGSGGARYGKDGQAEHNRGGQRRAVL